MTEKVEAASKLAQALGGGLLNGGSRPPAKQRAVVNMLEDIGIEPVVMNVSLNGVPTDCLVIPFNELVIKEYKHLTGVDAEALMRGKVITTAIESGNQSE